MKKRSYRIPAADVVARDTHAARLNRNLVADGYVLTATCKATRRRDGDVTVRLVWRRRAESEAVTLSLRCPARVVGGTLVIEADQAWVTKETWSVSGRLQLA